jgi:hypothetical protein
MAGYIHSGCMLQLNGKASPSNVELNKVGLNRELNKKAFAYVELLSVIAEISLGERVL